MFPPCSSSSNTQRSLGEGVVAPPFMTYCYLIRRCDLMNGRIATIFGYDLTNRIWLPFAFLLLDWALLRMLLDAILKVGWGGGEMLSENAGRGDPTHCHFVISSHLQMYENFSIFSKFSWLLAHLNLISPGLWRRSHLEAKSRFLICCFRSGYFFSWSKIFSFPFIKHAFSYNTVFNSFFEEKSNIFMLGYRLAEKNWSGSTVK